MATKYPTPPGDSVQPIVDAVKKLRAAQAAQQRPDSTRLAQLYAQVQTALANVTTSVATAFNALVASGITTPGGISAGGNIHTPATMTADTGVTSAGVYNNLVSTGAYKVQYINVSGQMGYVPSSRRFKQDIEQAPDVRSAALAIEVVTFRYKQAVEELGADATVEWGVIAEDVHALGLTWLVDYDDEGLPLGIKYERLALAVIPVIQDHEARLKAAGI